MRFWIHMKSNYKSKRVGPFFRPCKTGGETLHFLPSDATLGLQRLYSQTSCQPPSHHCMSMMNRETHYMGSEGNQIYCCILLMLGPSILDATTIHIESYRLCTCQAINREMRRHTLVIWNCQIMEPSFPAKCPWAALLLDPQHHRGINLDGFIYGQTSFFLDQTKGEEYLQVFFRGRSARIFWKFKTLGLGVWGAV